MDPLVPVDVDLRGLHFMPLDVNRLRDSQLAISASGDEFRAAVLLWCASWNQIPAASLPSDDQTLAAYAGFGRDLKGWRKVKSGAMRGFVQCDDGRFYHPVVAEKALEAWQERVEFRERQDNDQERVKNYRAEHKALRDALRELGVTMPFDAKISDLRAKLETERKLQTETEPVTPETLQALQDETETVTPVTVARNGPAMAKTGTGTGTGTGTVKAKALDHRADDRARIESDFETRFWPAYPRKVGKANALKAFMKINPDADAVTRMVAAVKLQAQSDQWRRDGGQYIPHPATWLNGRRWEDDPGGSAVNGNAPPSVPDYLAGAV